MGGEVGAGAAAVLEQHALGLGQGQDRLHGVLDAVDEAGGALRARLVGQADVEPDRGVEGRFLVQQDMRQLVLEGLGVRFGGEVVHAAAPVRHGVGDAADQLAHAALALRGADMAAEIFGDDDVGGELRPGFRDLDIRLLSS